MIFTLAVFAVLAAAHYFLPDLISGLYLYLVPFFAVTTAAFHVLVIKAIKKSSETFVTYYMGITGAKLFFYILLLLALLFLKTERVVVLVLTFMIIYFIFTLFEAIYTSRNTKG